MPWQLDRYLDDAAFRFNQRKVTMENASLWRWLRAMAAG
jgi:hypothetical protein